MATIREMIKSAGELRLRRAPAGPPVGPPFAGLGTFGGLGRFGNDAGLNQEQYLHFCGYVYSIIRTIANRIIGQPIFHARKIDPNEEKPDKSHKLARAVGVNKEYVPEWLKAEAHQLQTYTDSPILAAFRDPNPIMVRYTLLYNTVASLELTGKAYWWMRFAENGKPEIWPLPSHWVTPVHNPTLFSSWIVEPGAGAQRFQLPGSHVCYFYYPDPGDPLNAYAPLTALAKTVMADESLEEAQRRTFINSMSPGLAFTIGQAAEDSPTGRETSPVLTRAQRRALKTILKDEYKGVINSGEPMLLDGFIRDVKPVFATPKEMDYLNSGTSTKGRLAQGWGVNPISMGEIEGANRASSAVADDHLLNNVVNPRIAMLSEVMTRALPRFYGNRRNEVVYIQPAASKDIDWELNRDTAMLDRGAKSINEWREGHGMPPLEDGDRAHVPAGQDSHSGGWEDVIVDNNNATPSGPNGSKRKPKRRTGGGQWVPVKPVKSVKLVDSSGHEHGDDGKFGHGSGGGKTDTGKKPNPHGSVDDSDKEHASRAVVFMSKIKEHGKKAVKAAKSLATRAHQLSVEISWHVMTKNLADDICDTAADYSKIINAKGTGDWLTTHLGVSGNFAAKVGSIVLSYGLTKLKQFIAKRRRTDGTGDKLYDLWNFKADDDDDKEDDDAETKVDAVFKIVTGFAKDMGCPKDQLPSKDDVRAFIKKRDADKEDDSEDEDDEDDEKGFTLPAKSIAARWGVKATAEHFRDMVDLHRKELAATLSGVLASLGSQAVAEIRKYRGADAAQAVEHAINAEKWEEAIKDAAADVLARAAKSGAAGEWIVNHKSSEAKLMAKAGLPGRLGRAVAGMVTRLLGGKVWGRLVSWFVGTAKQAVGRAIRKGDDPGDAAAAVLTEPAAIGAAADKTADVEAGAAVNGGRHVAFKELLETGKVIARRWQTCRDARVRDTHRRAHGQVARGDAPFVVGGESCQYPGDPSLTPGQRCRCRCVAISISG